MPISEVLALGLVQGLTEFLPVSSSGHLLAVRFLFGWTDTEGTAFDAFLHLGTLVAVLIHYRQVWLGILRGLITGDREGQDKRELLAKLSIATVPAAVLGYWFQDSVAAALRTPGVLAVSLLITAGVLWGFDHWGRRMGTIARASFKDATLIGLAQAVALVPGISRSGVTIAAGRGRGLSRRQAANFSFLLSAPVIAGASLTSLANILAHHAVPMDQLAIGFFVALVSGLVAIRLLLKMVEKISFTPFAIYLVFLVGVLLWVG